MKTLAILRSRNGFTLLSQSTVPSTTVSLQVEPREHNSISQEERERRKLMSAAAASSYFNFSYSHLLSENVSILLPSADRFFLRTI